MKFLPSCREVQSLATEYREGTLPPMKRLGIGLHLLLCWACRAFLRSLDALPGISRKILKAEDPAPKAAEDALAKALEKIRG
jgi:anti-sigma factor ChrR (cupin superfamily)